MVTDFGCADGNIACYCSHVDFAYGIRDCTNAVCTDGSAIQSAIAYGQSICRCELLFFVLVLFRPRPPRSPSVACPLLTRLVLLLQLPQLLHQAPRLPSPPSLVQPLGALGALLQPPVGLAAALVDPVGHLSLSFVALPILPCCPMWSSRKLHLLSAKSPPSSPK